MKDNFSEKGAAIATLRGELKKYVRNMRVSEDPEKRKKEILLLTIADLNRLPMSRPQIMEYFHVRDEEFEKVIGVKDKRRLTKYGKCLIGRDLYIKLKGIEKEQEAIPEITIPVVAEKIPEPGPVIEVKEAVPILPAVEKTILEPVPQVEVPQIRAVGGGRYFSREEANEYFRSEIKKSGINGDAALFWVGIMLRYSENGSKSVYEKKRLEKEASRWCSRLKQPTAKIPEGLVRSPLDKTSKSKYVDFGLVYPEFFRNTEDSLKFIEEVLDFKGLKGYDFVNLKHPDEMQQIVRDSFSPRTNAYRRTSIEFLLFRYLLNKKVTRAKEPGQAGLEELSMGDTEA